MPSTINFYISRCGFFNYWEPSTKCSFPIRKMHFFPSLKFYAAFLVFSWKCPIIFKYTDKNTNKKSSLIFIFLFLFLYNYWSFFLIGKKTTWQQPHCVRRMSNCVAATQLAKSVKKIAPLTYGVLRGLINNDVVSI